MPGQGKRGPAASRMRLRSPDVRVGLVMTATTRAYETRPTYAQVIDRLQGFGVVLAQDSAAAVQGVLTQVAGRLHLAQHGQDDGQLVGGVQGVGVVLAQDPAAAVQEILIDAAHPVPV